MRGLLAFTALMLGSALSDDPKKALPFSHPVFPQSFSVNIGYTFGNGFTALAHLWFDATKSKYRIDTHMFGRTSIVFHDSANRTLTVFSGGACITTPTQSTLPPFAIPPSFIASEDPVIIRGVPVERYSSPPVVSSLPSAELFVLRSFGYTVPATRPRPPATTPAIPWRASFISATAGAGVISLPAPVTAMTRLLAAPSAPTSQAVVAASLAARGGANAPCGDSDAVGMCTAELAGVRVPLHPTAAPGDRLVCDRQGVCGWVAADYDFGAADDHDTAADEAQGERDDADDDRVRLVRPALRVSAPTSSLWARSLAVPPPADDDEDEDLCAHARSGEAQQTPGTPPVGVPVVADFYDFIPAVQDATVFRLPQQVADACAAGGAARARADATTLDALLEFYGGASAHEAAALRMGRLALDLAVAQHIAAQCSGKR